MLNYFGYGANRSQDRLAQILGHEVMSGRGALLSGFALAYQLLVEVPEPAKSILKSVWGDSFHCYTLKINPKTAVVGRLWTITEADLNKIKEWEFVGSWREIIEIKLQLADGSVLPGVTEKSLDKWPIHGSADGYYYLDLINERQPSFYKEDETRRRQEILKLKQQFKSMKQYLAKLRWERDRGNLSTAVKF